MSHTLLAQLDKSPQVTSATGDTAASPPPVTPPSAPPSAPTDPSGGFPHHGRYLTVGMANSVGGIWPRAERQLEEFFRCAEMANGKLAEWSVRLPDEFWQWWVREWADAVLWHTTFGGYGVADIRALYHFGRRLNRELALSDTPADTSRPRDLEFTYYDSPLMCGDGRGNCGLEPLATFGYQEEALGRAAAVPFPRTEPDGRRLAPRIGCDGFLHWAGFLASADPLTADQRDELGHVGSSEVGREEWCRATHGEQYRRFVTGILNRLRNAITSVSDALGIADELIPRDGRFDDALSAVSRWLTRANPAPPPTPPNAASRRKRPPSPAQQQRQAMQAAICQLRANGMTEGHILRHIGTPEGRDVREQVEAELKRKPLKKGSTTAKRSPKNVIHAALRDRRKTTVKP